MASLLEIAYLVERLIVAIQSYLGDGGEVRDLMDVLNEFDCVNIV
jgi:hypothetical protein